VATPGGAVVPRVLARGAVMRFSTMRGTFFALGVWFDPPLTGVDEGDRWVKPWRLDIAVWRWTLTVKGALPYSRKVRPKGD